MKSFPNRNELIKTYIAPHMSGAELGVFLGEFSEVLASLRPSNLFLVDLFEGITGSGDKDGNNMTYVSMSESRDNLLQKYVDNKAIQIIQSNTKDFLESIPDNSLDYIYIDADHSYEAVCIDLSLARHKVRAGGYIMGHDYISPRFDGVVKAVNEFCSRYNLEIDSLSECGCPTYCIINEK